MRRVADLLAGIYGPSRGPLAWECLGNLLAAYSDELNITYVDALQESRYGGDDMHVRRFLASPAIAMALPGVPAVYIQCLLGSRNWPEGVRSTGRQRSINREKLDALQLTVEIENPGTFRSRILAACKRMLQVRCAQPAFHPKAAFKILSAARQVFAIVGYADGQWLVALTNITSDQVAVDAGELGGAACRDLITNRCYSSGKVPLEPYGILWLTPAGFMEAAARSNRSRLFCCAIFLST